MLLERLQDLSLIYWLKDKFSAYPFVTVVDGFPETPPTIPCISVEWEVIEDYTVEIGNREQAHERIWYIDIFAKNKSQRDEITYQILNDLNDPIPVYDYNQGFPPTVSPNRLGGIILMRKTARNIQIIPELIDELYYRASIKYEATYDTY